MSMNKLLVLFLFLAASLSAQTTVSVSGPSSGWTGLKVSSDPVTTNFLADPLSDQRTGQGPDDMLGTSTKAGFFFDIGTVNGVQSIGFRIYMANYQSSGFTGNLRVGLDANMDGSADLFFGPKLSGSRKNQGIVFQAATGVGNYSPSTTALGNNTNRIPFSVSNYSYRAINSTIDPLWTNIGPNTNSVISFSIPTQTLKNVLSSLGFVITDDSYMTFLAFTSTQSSAINQDLYGSTGITNTARFDGVNGGFTDYYNLNGARRPRPIIPEPSTYGAILLLLIVVFILWRKSKS